MRPIEGKNYVNGAWISARKDFDSIDPFNGSVLGSFPQTTPEEVVEAVSVAKDAQKSWRKLSRIQRGEYFNNLCYILQEDADELVEIITHESGKNKNESWAEVNESLHMAQYTFGKARMPNGEVVPSEIAEKDCYIIRKPKGVIAVISPWNFPAAIGGFWCAAPALLEGNTVVWKPSEDTPLVAQMVTELYQRAGFPKGVFNLVHGDKRVGEELVYNKNINHYCFTGSKKVGQFIRQICAIQMNKTCSLEMGSKSAVIVCADADFDMSIKACIASAYKLSGQRCVSAGRILVEQSIFDKFAEEFHKQSANLNLAPLINEAQAKRVEAYNDLTEQDKNTRVLLVGMRHNNFLSPHVYTTKWNVPEDRAFLVEEVFGPHVALIPFETLDEAIAIYNDTEFGLSCAVCTNDYKKMRRIREECEFGLGYVNLPSIGAESSMPFGGVKNSGYGGSSAAATFETVVNKVTWTVNHADEIKMAQGLAL